MTQSTNGSPFRHGTCDLAHDFPRNRGRGRTPQLGVEITFPAVQPEVYPAAAHDHALASEAAHLFAERAGSRRECDAPVRAQHALPRQRGFRTGFAEHLPDQSRPPGKTGAGSDFAVAADAASRNRRDHAAYGRMRVRDFSANWFHRRFTLVSCYAGDAKQFGMDSPSRRGANGRLDRSCYAMDGAWHPKTAELLGDICGRGH